MAATQATFAACPLALVSPSNETGRVMILANCGTFGVPDVQANKRPCPIGKDKFEPCMKAIIGARHAGNPEPAKLNDGEIYVMITPVERKAMFSRALKNPNMKTGKNKARTHVRKKTLTITEPSWRKRQQRTKGFAKLTQSVYIGGNWSTLAHVKHSTFATLSGSTKSDVIGPVDLDDPADLAMIHHSKVKEYYGKRYILAGGN